MTSVPTVTNTRTQTTTDTVTPSTTAVVTVTSTNTTTAVSTVTTTVTPISNVCPTPSATCGNQGLRFAVYPNTNSAGSVNTNRDSTYSSFDPALFKKRTPEYVNTTSRLGGINYPLDQQTQITIYNSTRTFNSDYFTINHVGYIYAQVTGVYTFTISQSDDITMLWVGAFAYRGYTRANANAINPYGAGSTKYSVNFNAGTYYPIRIVFGQAQGAVIFSSTLTAPDGRVILNPNSAASPYLVQYSCDGTLAPPFDAFGSES